MIVDNKTLVPLLRQIVDAIAMTDSVLPEARAALLLQISMKLDRLEEEKP